MIIINRFIHITPINSVMCNRMAAHIERGTAFRRATMWTINQIMESGAMGVQITISGKLRGDRSAFEKHTQGKHFFKLAHKSF